jgi:hypothetical protein
MANKCIYCGCDNDVSATRCGCGQDLPAAVQPANVAPAPGSPASPSILRRVLPRIGFALWAIGFVPLFVAVRSFLHMTAFQRSLIGTAVLCACAVAASFLFGGDKRRSLRVWRILYLLWALALTPLVLVIAEGLAEHGWPSGRFNRHIASLLRLVLLVTVPAYLTGISASIKSYRLTGVLAVVTGLLSVVGGIFMFDATSPFRHRSVPLVDVLDVLMFGAKVETYVSIPVGIVFVVGGILTFRAARARVRGPDDTSATPSPADRPIV